MSKTQPQQCDYLVIDISNLLHRTFHVHKQEDVETITGLAHHSALMTINSYFQKFKPRKKIVLCSDRSNWRKEYTKSDKCLSKKLYKGNREKLTKKEKEKYQQFLQHVSEFEQLIRDHTKIVMLAEDQLEADDLIAGFVQMYSDENEIVIISTDKDFIQLLRFPNVTLFDPNSNKPRTLEDWNNDADLFMFEKCIRGDTSDNIQSAFPRCRKTRILKAYEDPYERVNLMSETWTDHEGTEFKVKDLFEENKMLMDLTCQPPEIQKKIITAILREMKRGKSFSYFHFMKFLGKNELKEISRQAERFAEMFNL